MSASWRSMIHMVQVCLPSWTQIVLLEPKFHPQTLLVLTPQTLLKLKLQPRHQPERLSQGFTIWVAMVPGPLGAKIGVRTSVENLRGELTSDFAMRRTPAAVEDSF